MKQDSTQHSNDTNKSVKAKKNGTYNVGTGKPRSFQEVADILQLELDTNFSTEYFPNPYDGYLLHTQADISSSKQFLDFHPNINLEQGISSYLPEIKRLNKEEII